MEKIQGSKVLKRKTRTDRKPLKLFLKPRLYSCPEFLNDLNLLLEECGVFQQTGENLTPQVNKPCHLKSFCKADGEGVDLRIFFIGSCREAAKVKRLQYPHFLASPPLVPSLINMRGTKSCACALHLLVTEHTHPRAHMYTHLPLLTCFSDPSATPLWKSNGSYFGILITSLKDNIQATITATKIYQKEKYSRIKFWDILSLQSAFPISLPRRQAIGPITIASGEKQPQAEIRCSKSS